MTKAVKVHFMGVGGSGVSGVAKLADRMGYKVSGCDLEKNTAYSKNVVWGHSTRHIKGVDLVVISPAVYYQNSDHPEFIGAKTQGKLMTWQKFLGQYLARGKKMICIAGTHGKSTTTAMAAKLLIDVGADPLALVGAKVPQWHGNGRFGKGGYFIVEADEFFDNFLNYHPEIIILNNIEFDHPDFFKSEEQLFDSYKKFISNLTGEKVLIVNSDDAGVNKLLAMINLKKLKIIEYSPERESLGFKLKVIGKHNIANALGVKALGRYLGIDSGTIRGSLTTFAGIERRLQLLGEGRCGFLVYDDYAHHPTAIAATIGALRQKYPKGRLVAVVEAHGFKRTHALIKKYEGVFEKADQVLIGPIYKARDKETFGITPSVLAKASGHPNIIACTSFARVLTIIKSQTKKGDIILVMGAGKSYLWARKILQI